MLEKIKIGTRGSPLALVQAKLVQSLLHAAHPNILDVDIVVIKTTGDQIQDRPLAEIGGKGLFTKEIEDQLLSGDIDLAVHSSKDMPTVLPKGLILPIFLKREDPSDAFIGQNGMRLSDLPQNSIVGTASLRRKAQLLRARPDLKIVSLRGNVGTRLDKIKNNKLSGTLLATAGLNRLNMAHEITEILDFKTMLPAPAQGAIAIEIRVENGRIYDLLKPLHCKETHLCVTAERSLLAQLDGSCRTPIAALATLEGDDMCLRAKVFSLDGKQCFSAHNHKTINNLKDAETLGFELGKTLVEDAGLAFFEALKGEMDNLQEK